MSPQAYYQQNIQKYTQQLKQIKSCRNLVTLAKVLTFMGVISQIYWLITVHSVDLIFPIGTIILFVYLTWLDNKIVKREKLTEQLLRISQEENDYLKGNLNHFANGKIYLDPQHPYAVDLDLFGEDSLFQHLNRTVTGNGTHLLAEWLLHLTLNPETIRKRQQAVKELTEHPDWCHQFRASGQLYPNKNIDLDIVHKWQNKPDFFAHLPKARLFLYIANGITIIAWVLAVFQIFPWSLGLILSLFQLLALTLFLKKINAYHRQLDLFLGIVSNYLVLVRLIHQQKFTSSSLCEIKYLLTGQNHSARKALALLNRIQGSLDQRGNILTAFFLNGIYLRDLHLMVRVDQWKKVYSTEINKWIQAISKMDALVSMANYRMNHPDYTQPEISQTLLLNAREIGHPLLKNKNSVTNDFQLESLHQLFVVTGANMAGKSTFLRTVGINLVLAQSGNVVYSRHFSFQPMTLFTSMRTTDNLAKNISYFHAELLRLKQLIEVAQNSEHTFIILDEMLKGTNSTDKLNGSRAFLHKLLLYPISGLIATHDLALGELARSYPSNFYNICFEITHQGSDIIYDYKVYPGVSANMNATILLQQMGLI